MITRSFVAAFGAVMLSAPLALAQPDPNPRNLEMAKKHYAMGEQLFGLGSLKGAVEEFKEAYRLTRNPLLLYNIGFVYDKLDDTPMALHYYKKYLADTQDSPKTHKQREQVEKRIRVLEGGVDEAPAPAAPEATPAGVPAAAALSGAASAPAPLPAHATETAPRAAQAAGFGHDLVEEAPPGHAIDLTVRVPENSAWTVVAHYRSAGEEKFHDAAMHARGAELCARIPARAVRGSALHYYIEAKNGAGAVIASSGSAEAPNLIDLDPSAKPHFFVDSAADAEALRRGPIDFGAPDRDRDAARKLTKMKWVATGATIGTLGLGVAFYVQAANYAKTLEAEAFQSAHECSAPPCRTYNAERASLESTGHLYQTLGYVALGVGAAGAITSGILWYVDAKRQRSERNHRSAPVDDVTAGAADAPKKAAKDQREKNQRFVAPMVGDGIVGAAVGGTF